IEKLEERGITPVIPSKKNRRNPRKILFSLYKKRNIIERFFARPKQFRGIATRYDKLKSTFCAAAATHMAGHSDHKIFGASRALKRTTHFTT
ncbi:transposase, partial [Acetobacter sp.]|uniref:transposase n=1 Tax=Acetobacter sp. TaxID=440 RepID=UPI0025889E8E